MEPVVAAEVGEVLGPRFVPPFDPETLMVDDTSIIGLGETGF